MDYDLIAFWFLFLNCLTGLIVTLARFRRGARGWIPVYLGILLVCVIGQLREQRLWIYAGGALWLAFVLAPVILSLWYYRRVMQQRYSTARRLAQITRWLHPADGWRQQPEILRALELAQRNQLPEARAILKRFENLDSPAALSAMSVLFRLTGEWQEFLDWEAMHERQLDALPQFLPHRLRARGEAGDLRGLIEFYGRHQAAIARLGPPSQRDLCRLMLFAFCGRRGLVDELYRGSLAVLPGPVREFWLATTDQAGGRPEPARCQLEALLASVDPSVRAAVERRLARPIAAATALSVDEEKILERAETERSQDQRFGAAPKLFSRTARATQLLLALNALMFAAEIYEGGSENGEALYRLGALFAPAVHHGEWWRLVTANFLHFGWLHLVMNMLGLCVLGPLTEVALGSRRFLFVYLSTGIGSMLVVTSLASGPFGGPMLVGASGCVMGLIGATGALMLRGWMRERATAAGRRLVTVCALLAMQFAFDSVVPQVSMTAHLSGAAIGFGVTLLLRDRLRIAEPLRSEVS